MRSYHVTADANHVIGIISGSVQSGNVAHVPTIEVVVSWFEDPPKLAPTE